MILKNTFLFIIAAATFQISIAQKNKSTIVPHTTWSKQSNIYEVNLRQFSAAGTFSAFEKQLPRLKKMGVEIIWFMPITPIGIKGRKMTESDLGSYYSVRDYKGINPEFGNINNFKSLVKKAHSMGLKVIVDWVANHSAPDNPWATQHSDFYVKDSAGNFVSPYDWTDVIKLNYNNHELRDSMIGAMKYWLTAADIDGFRCDVAEGVAPDFWKECIATLRKTKDVFMLAEGNNALMHEVGFDETYNWDVMSFMTDLYKGKINLKEFETSLNNNINNYPKNAYRLYFTSNHDENSWNGTEFEKYGDAYKTFAVLTQTMYQSVPLIYNGQESEFKRRLKFFVKDSIDWKNYSLSGFYATLLKLRRSNPALAADANYKRLQTTNDDAIFCYTRENNGHKVLVVLNMSNKKQQFKISDNTINGNAFNVFLKLNSKLNSNENFTAQPWGYMVYDYK